MTFYPRPSQSPARARQLVYRFSLAWILLGFMSGLGCARSKSNIQKERRFDEPLRAPPASTRHTEPPIEPGATPELEPDGNGGNDEQALAAEDEPELGPRLELVETELTFEADGKPVTLFARFQTLSDDPTKRPGVILLPGGGNISMRGTRAGNGVEKYAKSVDVTALASERLALAGFVVLSYNKRTYQGEDSPAAQPQEDIDALGPQAMSIDVDAACAVMREHENFDGRLILVAPDQAGHVALSSACAQESTLVVLISPIPGRVDKVMVAGMYARAKAAQKRARADKDEAAAAAASEIKNRAGSLEATFSALRKGKFPSDTRVFGATVAFWQGWMDLTEAPMKSKSPAIIVRGLDDHQYAAADVDHLQTAAEEAGIDMVSIPEKDHYLIPLDESTWMPILRAIQKKLDDAPSSVEDSDDVG